MSGGSYNYLCFRVEEEYVDRMYDIELDSMMKDLSKILHDLEWWQSSDISEDQYRKTVQEFKNKWFGKRDERFYDAVIEKCENFLNDVKKL